MEIEELALWFLTKEGRESLAQFLPDDFPGGLCACMGPSPVCYCQRRWLDACLNAWAETQP